jgi:hypothetical protein
MFAPPVAKLQAKTPAGSINGPARQRSALIAQRPMGLIGAEPVGDYEQGGNLPGLIAEEAAPGVLWSFSAIPIFGQQGHQRHPRFGAPLPRGTIQSKLAVGRVDDPLEQEADRIADQVMRMPEPRLQRVCTCGGKCPECQKKQSGPGPSQIGRQAEHDAKTVAPSAVHELLSSSGQSLDTATRSFMETRFGYDFGKVRIHTDRQAAASTRTVNALAYTIGQDVVFGEGQYAPQTLQGRRLLAHELTHVVQQNGAIDGTLFWPHKDAAGEASERATDSVVDETTLTGAAPALQHRLAVPTLQRQGGGGATPARNYPYSVTTSGCNAAPFVTAAVETAANSAFTTVRDSNCIKTNSLKESILAEFNGLEIKCNQGTNQLCGRANRYFSHTVNIYANALQPLCGPLDSTILHEVIHLTEWAPLGHGDLAGACEKSCFGWGSGDASGCTFEKGFVPVVGASGGRAFPAVGTPTWEAHLYLGLEKRGPVLSFIHPSLGIGIGLIGESSTGAPEAIPAGTSGLFSLLGGLRLDPGQPGGGYISFFGGPAVVLGSGKTGVGGEAGTALGYRWRWLDLSLDAGVDYDPTREAGMGRFFTLGASIKIGPSVPH